MINLAHWLGGEQLAHPLARWRTSGVLIDIGEVNIGGGDAILIMNGETVA